jgi:hypothetical protein
MLQFESQALLRHLRSGWQFSGLLKDHFIYPVPAQTRLGDEDWYKGTADAIFQNLDLIDVVDDQVIAIFGADHIYRMDVRNMIDFHERKQAQVTVAAIPVPSQPASEFGVIEVAADGAILGFHEKNPDAPRMAGDPMNVYASMGNGSLRKWGVENLFPLRGACQLEITLRDEWGLRIRLSCQGTSVGKCRVDHRSSLVRGPAAISERLAWSNAFVDA